MTNTTTTLRIVEQRFLWFGLSAIVIIPGIIALATGGIRIGIDFKSGSVIEYTTPNTITLDQAQNIIKNLDLKTKTIQLSGDHGFTIHTDALTQDQHDQLRKSVQDAIPGAGEGSYSTVGPTIGKDETNKAIIRVIVAAVVIIFYIAWAFRKVPKPANSWRFGICAVAALAHDLLFVVGMFALLSRFVSYAEVDSLFITALLTIMGFSVHDTIVVFDRIRENLRLNPGAPFAYVANLSIVQTIARSLNTSLTVLLVLLTLFLIGGQSTKGFTLALLLGIAIGTYSSIFNATPLLVLWQERGTKKRS